MNSPDLLAALNPQQREAVLAIDGPVLILAGAGSGKTRVITTRIAHLVRACKASPRARSSRSRSPTRPRARCASGSPGCCQEAPEAWIPTFHSFCVRLLRREAAAAGLPASFVIYDEDDQLQAVRGALRALDLSEKLHPPRRVLSRISAAKNARSSRAQKPADAPPRRSRPPFSSPPASPSATRPPSRRRARSTSTTCCCARCRCSRRSPTCARPTGGASATCWSTSTRTRTACSTSWCACSPDRTAT